MAVTSKAIQYQTFINTFNKQKLDDLYMIYGTEEYLKVKAINAIVARAVKPEHKDFDFELFYGDEANSNRILDSLASIPFLAEKKVILIRKFDKLRSTEQQKITEMLVKEGVGNLIILTAENIDNRLKVSKLFYELGTVVQCKSPYKPEDMIPWVTNELKANGKNIDSQGAYLFVNKVELDYLTASGELEKLLLFCKDKAEVTLADVQACTGNSKTNNIFEFLNAVGAKDVRKSLMITQNLLDNKESAVFIITMMLRLFMSIWQINILRKKGFSDYDISAKYMNDINYAFRGNYLNFANKYPLSVIEKVFTLMLEADTDLKSINVEESIIIERTLFRIFAL